MQKNLYEMKYSFPLDKFLIKYKEGKANQEVPFSSPENDIKILTFFIVIILQISAYVEGRIC